MNISEDTDESPDRLSSSISMIEIDSTYAHVISEPRIALLKRFNGKHSEFLSFMIQYEINFIICPKIYVKLESKIMFIIANLDDISLQWAHDIFLNAKHSYRTNYEVFKKTLYNLYDNHIYLQDIEDRLLSLA